MGSLHVHPPLYLLEATTPCWRCGASTRVVALACEHVEGKTGGSAAYEDISEANEPTILSTPTELPAEVLDQIRQGQPNFALRSSRTAGEEYYGNFCSASPHWGLGGVIFQRGQRL